ncbi:unnamed protein product [Polarella glacialis]|uniref:Uncharacterized protein n=1 Tax=Polarella glacialis TaxID=89957 RepID=A0A813K9D9_POLGL|nr:unnamed protein product [Polarella glacialis]CAE8693266.1 unnamed protein product [Polarella glacialis]
MMLAIIVVVFLDICCGHIISRLTLSRASWDMEGYFSSLYGDHCSQPQLASLGSNWPRWAEPSDAQVLWVCKGGLSPDPLGPALCGKATAQPLFCRQPITDSFLDNCGHPSVVVAAAVGVLVVVVIAAVLVVVVLVLVVAAVLVVVVVVVVMVWIYLHTITALLGSEPRADHAQSVAATTESRIIESRL